MLVDMGLSLMLIKIYIWALPSMRYRLLMSNDQCMWMCIKFNCFPNLKLTETGTHVPRMIWIVSWCVKIVKVLVPSGKEDDSGLIMPLKILSGASFTITAGPDKPKTLLPRTFLGDEQFPSGLLINKYANRLQRTAWRGFVDPSIIVIVILRTPFHEKKA